MTEKEKAKAYDKALQKAKYLHEAAANGRYDIEVKTFECIFPELKETEDEKIRKELIDYINRLTVTPNNIDKYNTWIAWLEKQGEHNLTDKVEPKFKVGNWIINKYMRLVMQILNNDNGFYKTVDTDGIERNYSYDFMERNFKLWTIQDAKDGDVIYLPNGNNEYYFFIFKGIENAAVMTFAHFYQYNDGTSKVEGTIDKLFSVNDVFQPATKEQHDILFAKMKEAGYEWDAEKKEVRKIECKIAESEGERIRKAIIKFLIDVNNGAYTKSELEIASWIAWLEKQGEQKSIYMVKPKFKVGDWCIDNKDGVIFQIVKVLSNTYTYKTNEGKEYSCTHYSLENDAKLWTIQDAKDGDILVSKHNQPFIYNGIFDEECIGAYCGIDKFGNDFLEDTFSCDWSAKKGVKPATEEQRYLLFQKMKEAGYEWNPYKKKLSKIEDESENYKQQVMSEMTNSVKDYIRQNPSWGEEDEKMVKDIIASIDTLYYHGMVNWLKSLKDRVQHQNRWKPSKEQIIALRWVLNNIPYNKHKEEISGLLDQIKDL